MKKNNKRIYKITFFLLLLLVIGFHLSQPTCKYGTDYNGRHFLCTKNGEGYTFQEASSYCKGKGMVLASLSDLGFHNKEIHSAASPSLGFLFKFKGIYWLNEEKTLFVHKHGIRAEKELSPDYRQ